MFKLYFQKNTKHFINLMLKINNINKTELLDIGIFEFSKFINKKYLENKDDNLKILQIENIKEFEFELEKIRKKIYFFWVCIILNIIKNIDINDEKIEFHCIKKDEKIIKKAIELIY